MKRFAVGLLVVAASLVLVAPADAQTTRSSFGFTAGATTGDLQGGLVNTSSRWGFTGGVFGSFRTSRNSSIGLQANYTQKGGNDFARLDYLEVPFLVGAIIPTDNDRINFNFYTGIALAFKLSCSADEGVTDLCDDAKGTEWSWPIGLAFAVQNANRGKIGLDVRYSLGISDAFNGSVARNRSWQFRAFYAIPMD